MTAGGVANVLHAFDRCLRQARHRWVLALSLGYGFWGTHWGNARVTLGEWKIMETTI